MRLQFLVLAFLISAVSAGEVRCQADAVRLLIEYSRSTKIFSRLPDTTEIWFGDNATAVRSRGDTVLIRYDLGRRFVLHPSRKTYVEQPLKREGSAPKDTSIHTKGWEYAPRYDWTLDDLKEEETVRGYDCRHYRLRGEADYSQRSLDLWLTKESPIRLDRYNDSRLWEEVPGDPRSEELFRALPELYSWAILSCTENLVPAIAPDATMVWRVVLIEQKEPPPDVFEIPDSFQPLEGGEHAP